MVNYNMFIEKTELNSYIVKSNIEILKNLHNC